mgnify:CR=1 FL=1
MTKLFIHHHLGLGDHLDCNGMVRHIQQHGGVEGVWRSAHQYDTVGVFSKPNYFNMIEYMYRDTDKIEVFKVSKDNEYGDVKQILEEDPLSNLITVGHQHYPGKQTELSQNKNCWEFFYEQIEMPYDIRYKEFYVERDLEEERRVFDKLNPNNESYIFIHEDSDRGFLLNREHFIDKNLKIIENDVTENIFHFTKIIEEAQEIHCMESSFKTLIDFYAKQDHIFYHDIRESQPLGQHSSPKWKVVSYE